MRAFLGMLAARQIMVVLELARHREEARCAEAVPRWTRPTWRLRARDERPPGSHVFEDDLFSFPPLVVLGAASVLASEGLTSVQIEHEGRWKSDAWRRYLEPALEDAATITATLTKTRAFLAPG